MGLLSPFASSVGTGILPSSKALACIPSGLGAICQNTKGLEAFKDASASRFLVNVFVSKKYVVALNEATVPLANGVEELLHLVSSFRSNGVDIIIEILNNIANFAGGCSSALSASSNNFAGGCSSDFLPIKFLLDPPYAWKKGKRSPFMKKLRKLSFSKLITNKFDFELQMEDMLWEQHQMCGLFFFDYLTDQRLKDIRDFHPYSYENNYHILRFFHALEAHFSENGVEEFKQLNPKTAPDFTTVAPDEVHEALLVDTFQQLIWRLYNILADLISGLATQKAKDFYVDVINSSTLP